jgi:hypothetical protein
LSEQPGGIFNDENNPEMSQHHFEINRISDGLAFGHGTISGNDDEPEVLAQVDNIIHSSGDILVPIDCHDSGKALEDDGCGDGRAVAEVFNKDRTFKKSLNRAKVFGGSPAMAAASLVGVGAVKYRSFRGTFKDAVDLLNRREMDFGGHTDEKASGDNCGCGAIDRAPEAILAALKYEKPIRGVIDALGVDDTNLDAVYGNFRDYVNEIPANNTEPYRGIDVMKEDVIGSGKIVKKLGGEHRERRIILNMVRGYTVNQQLIREQTEGRAQAFAVDIPRLEDIAENLFPEQPDKQAQSHLSQLIYTLSIAAVLTKGDLPVYMVQDAPASVVA